MAQAGNVHAGCPFAQNSLQRHLYPALDKKVKKFLIAHKRRQLNRCQAAGGASDAPGHVVPGIQRLIALDHSGKFLRGISAQISRLPGLCHQGCTLPGHVCLIHNRG